MIADEPICVAIPASHPLAVQTAVHLSDLAGGDWIFCPVPDDDGINAAFFHACAAAGFAPRITHHAEGSALASDLVAARALSACFRALPHEAIRAWRSGRWQAT